MNLLERQNNVNNLLTYYRKLIHPPTRVSGYSSSILDNIYTNQALHEENGVIMTDITDHYSIFIVCEDPEPIINRNVEKGEITILKT